MDLVYAEQIRCRIKTEMRISRLGSGEYGIVAFINPNGQLDSKSVKVICFFFSLSHVIILCIRVLFYLAIVFLQVKWDHKGSEWVCFGDIMIETDRGSSEVAGPSSSTGAQAHKQPRVHQTRQMNEKKIPEVSGLFGTLNGKPDETEDSKQEFSFNFADPLVPPIIVSYESNPPAQTGPSFVPPVQRNYNYRSPIKFLNTKNCIVCTH